MRKRDCELRIVREPSEIEYWLLELAVECWTPLCYLGGLNFAGLFNVRFDGLDRTELLSSLERMLAAGDIRLRQDHETIPAPGRKALEEILDRSPPRQPVTSASLDPFYGVTARGGGRWESLARADWERYSPLSHEERDGAYYGVITATDRGRVECFLAGVKAYKSFFVYEGPDEWEVLTPWEATHWKTFPSGHRVAFRCRQATHVEYKPAPRWFREFQEWFQRPFGPRDPEWRQPSPDPLA